MTPQLYPPQPGARPHNARRPCSFCRQELNPGNMFLAVSAREKSWFCAPCAVQILLAAPDPDEIPCGCDRSPQGFPAP